MSALLDEEVLQALLPGQLNEIKNFSIEIKSYSLFIHSHELVSRVASDRTFRPCLTCMKIYCRMLYLLQSVADHSWWSDFF